jgi:hypothetical protein
MLETDGFTNLMREEVGLRGYPSSSPGFAAQARHLLASYASVDKGFGLLRFYRVWRK